MNIERTYQIIINDYNLEKLKIEEDIEATINTPMDISDKLIKIKTLINNLTMVENNLNKFITLIGEEKK
jgi:hypothetical protein